MVTQQSYVHLGLHYTNEEYTMAKVAFMGAGSTVFAKNVLGDTLLADPLRD